MTNWYQASDFIPSGGPVAAGAAGSTLQGGWIDVHGNQWSIDSSNRLISVANSSAFNLGELARPSSEASVNGRNRVKFTYAAALPIVACYSRWSNSGSQATGYIAVVNASGIIIYKNISGTTTVLGSGPAIALAVGTTYVFDVSTVQTNGTTTTIAATLYAADGATPIATLSVNDTTASLQNISKSMAIYQNFASDYINELTTYTDTAAGAATAYTLSGPASGGSGLASFPFTVAANGSLSTNVTVTPSDGGAGGIFTPSTLTLTSATTGGTFTYTPAAPASYTISATNNAGLTNPASVPFTALTSIFVNSTSFHFSPANWKGDTGRGGSVYRQTWNVGAYFDLAFTAGASPTASLLIASNPTSLPISYFVNGVLYDNVSTANIQNLSLQGLVPNAVNSVRVYVRSSTLTSRWGGTNTLQIQGAVIDNSSAPAPTAAPSKWILVNGDSIQEGFNVDAGATNFLHSSTFFIIEEFRLQGYDVGVMAAVGSGFQTTGNGNVPALYSIFGGTYNDSLSRWNKIDSGLSLLDGAGQISAYGVTGTTPVAIFLNFGTNDANTGVSAANVQASTTGVFNAYATAAPNAKLIFVPGAPLSAGTVSPAINGSNTLAAVQAGFAAAAAANPNVAFTYYDIGATLGAQVYNFAANHYDNFHPTLAGNAYLIGVFMDLIKRSFTPATVLRFAAGFR